MTAVENPVEMEKGGGGSSEDDDSGPTVVVRQVEKVEVATITMKTLVENPRAEREVATMTVMETTATFAVSP